MTELDAYLFQKGLTFAQVKIARMLMSAKSPVEIADKLCVCKKTVRAHITQCYRKMDVKKREQFMVKVAANCPNLKFPYHVDITG